MQRSISFILVLAALQGCSLATPYQAKGSHAVGGGYEDRKLDEHTFWVSYVGNGWSTPEQVLAFWHQRANELCHGPPKEITNGRADRTITMLASAGTIFIPVSSTWPTIEGTITCT
jgi:hypothetical protein